MKKRNAHHEARRRWGRVRVLGPPRATRRRIRPSGTLAERRIIERVVGRALCAADMADAIKLLRTGARLKELEINTRIESMLQPDPDE